RQLAARQRLEAGQHHAPADEASHVLVGGRAVGQVQQAGRAPAQDRDEVADAEGIRVAADAVAEVPGHASRQVPQGRQAAVARVPDARVDVAGVRALRILEMLREPSLPRGVLAGDDTRGNGNGAVVQLVELVRRPGGY